MKKFSIGDFELAAIALFDLIKEHGRRYVNIYGIPKGGVPLAIQLSNLLQIPLTDVPCPDTLIVDDIVDTGQTRLRFKDYYFASIHVNMEHCKYPPNYHVHKTDEYIKYFWEENEQPVSDNIIRILEYIGEDPNREGLKDTPRRIIESYKTLFSGYDKNIKDVMTMFKEECDESILLKNIDFYSMCEHHMLPFFGKVHVCYIPKNSIVLGASKVARIVEIYARRLQIQERLTNQIAKALMDALEPIGVACMIEAYHLCMQMRGIEKQNSTMVTTSLKGAFLNDASAKSEFMSRVG